MIQVFSLWILIWMIIYKVHISSGYSFFGVKIAYGGKWRCLLWTGSSNYSIATAVIIGAGIKCWN